MRGQGACQATNFLALRRMKKSKVIKAVGRRELKVEKLQCRDGSGREFLDGKTPISEKKLVCAGRSL
jgi:hypothetical protein